jgi:SAM-dependent methyltransferase
VEKQWTFDSTLTQNYTKVRQAFASEFLTAVRQQIELRTALDMGCGVGYFSKFLSDMGFRVVAVDGRDENAVEGKRRHPDITFLTRNVEDPALSQMGTFDFVLCVGLLYHLENPFRAIRNLHALTEKVLLLESMCTAGPGSTLQLLDEGPADNQGLSYVAFYPSESCIVKMLYRAGFPFVYRFARLPSDDQFITTLWRKQLRTFLAASKIALTAPNVILAKEPHQFAFEFRPWATPLARLKNYLKDRASRLRFLLRPLRRRADTLPSNDVGAKS